MENSGKYYGFIYMTTNTVNGKRYVGKCVYDERGTWRTYLGSGVLLKKSIRKYGKQQFQREIIDYALSKDELNQKEQYWINYFNAVSDSMFYNIASGGDGGYVLSGYSDDEIERIKEKHRNAIIKAAKQGKMCTNNKLSENDVVEIIRRIHKNDCLADIARDYGVSEMTIGDIKNKRTWFDVVGNEDFSEYRTLYKGNRSKAVKQFDSNMNLIAIYKNAREAERQTGIGYKMISKVCRGERPHTHGYIFQFAS